MDASNHPSRDTRPGRDDATLLTLARSRMLAYHSLRALPTDARSIRPVGPSVTDPESWRHRVGVVYPLELDRSTQEERMLARDASAYTELRPSSRSLDMLTGRVPGTVMFVGMSRRLFEACRNLTAEEALEEEAIAGEPIAFEIPSVEEEGGPSTSETKSTSASANFGPPSARAKPPRGRDRVSPHGRASTAAETVRGISC